MSARWTSFISSYQRTQLYFTSQSRYRFYFLSFIRFSFTDAAPLPIIQLYTKSKFCQHFFEKIGNKTIKNYVKI